MVVNSRRIEYPPGTAALVRDIAIATPHYRDGEDWANIPVDAAACQRVLGVERSIDLISALCRLGASIRSEPTPPSPWG
jgi:hypothetical protein